MPAIPLIPFALMNMCVSVWGREREIQVWVINGRVCIGLSAVSINTFWLSCTYQSNVLYCFRVLEDNYYHLCNIHWLHKDINNNYWMYKQLDRSLVVESGQIKQLKTFVANRLIFKLKKKKSLFVTKMMLKCNNLMVFLFLWDRKYPNHCRCSMSWRYLTL